MQYIHSILYKSKSIVCLALILGLMMPACKTKKAVKGGVIGATAGGVAGAAIGKKSGNTVLGAIIGAVVGGTAGVLIGRYMDKQAEELKKDLKDAKVERVGEGILITFDSGLLFDYNSSKLRATTQSNLQELSSTLKKYEDTDILIEGHTDNTGGDAYNQQLSEERANGVADFLAGQGVLRSRFQIRGYGENQPVASNESESGRQKNRRVDIAITANRKLQKAAEKGQI